MKRKFESIDNRYFERRAAMRSELGDMDPFFVGDQFPLFAGSVTLGRYLAIYDLLRRVIELPGHIAELGCWHGANLAFLAKVSRVLAPNSATKVFGFDSFEGLNVFDQGRDPTTTAGLYKGDPALLAKLLDVSDVSGSVELVKGNIEETLPAFVAEKKDLRFSFVYFDTDLYSSTRVGLEVLYPRLLKGGIMVFDEYNTAEWPGETSAVHEVLGEEIVLHTVPHTRQPTAFLVK